MIISDENEKGVAATSGVLESTQHGSFSNYEMAMHARNNAQPVSISNNYEMAMCTRNHNNNGQNQKFKKNGNLQCEVCKRKGHTKENCYRVVRYPSDFKFQRKVNNTSAAYNANVMQDHVGSTSQFNPEYGHNTNLYVPSANMGKEVYGHNTRNVRTQPTGSYNHNCATTQQGNYAFTSEQYKQILRMLNKGTNNNSNSVAPTNIAGSLHWERKGDR
ncbi:uncharacterized protein LOC132606806 isoform X2 [Lycium barbarum]|uniref:uncharacterized protein LOC132606806 isoform X2 n=1 Tax=Lycium barbarum TaxID=112863 RepID=UPI00293EA8B8|nr:uncharacterized protein LOC132606806 isoform X2 [Lycium barbarum]